MFRPSSGECSAPPCGGDNSNLTDVWGSALAVDIGVVPSARVRRITDWFGAHYQDVVPHLPMESLGYQHVTTEIYYNEHR